MDPALMQDITTLVNQGRLSEEKLRAMVAQCKFEHRGYKMATDTISDDAVVLILDAACMYSPAPPNSTDNDALWYRGFVGGLEMALGAILSWEEDPAETILREGLAASDLGKTLQRIEADEAAQLDQDPTEWNGYRVGDGVLVALEAPGPGGRLDSFLWRVDGTIVGVPNRWAAGGTEVLSVEFRLDEENWADWNALMPDAVPEDPADAGQPPYEASMIPGATWIDHEINPGWIERQSRDGHDVVRASWADPTPSLEITVSFVLIVQAHPDYPSEVMQVAHLPETKGDLHQLVANGDYHVEWEGHPG